MTLREPESFIGKFLVVLCGVFVVFPLFVFFLVWPAVFWSLAAWAVWMGILILVGLSIFVTVAWHEGY